MESPLHALEMLDGSGPVAENHQNQSKPSMAYNSTELNYLAVWVDAGTPATLRGRLLSEAGAPPNVGVRRVNCGFYLDQGEFMPHNLYLP